MMDFSTPGPLARRVTDIVRAAASADVHVPDDPSSLPHHRDSLIGALGEDIAGLRIGIPRAYFFDNCGPGIAESVQSALAVLEQLGVTLTDISLSRAAGAHQPQTTIMLAEYVSATDGRFYKQPGTFGASVLQRLQIGAGTTAVEYVDAQRWRRQWKETLRATFETIDIIATPTVPVPPPATGAAGMIEAIKAVSRNTYAWSLADLPAMTLPCGHWPEGSP